LLRDCREVEEGEVAIAELTEGEGECPCLRKLSGAVELPPDVEGRVEASSLGGEFVKSGNGGGTMIEVNSIL